MNHQEELIDTVFQAMITGRVNYQIIRFPPTGRLMIDLRNGMLMGDMSCSDCKEQKDES